MKHKVFVAISIIIGCIPLPAITPAEGAQNPRAPVPVIVTRKDTGKTVRIPIGANLIVRLESNPTTGYEWRAAGRESDCLRAAGKPRYLGPAGGGLGAGGTQIFTYKSMRPGKARLIFLYERSWERTPIDSFTLTVVVNPN